jgi:hypothetical protein
VRRSGTVFALLAVAVAAACGGIRTVSHDGYRALLVFSSGERYPLAVRGEKRRVEGNMDGSDLVKIFRPDLAKVWQCRPSTKRLLEERWNATDEIVPGYPLEPRFDPHAYADRFGGEIKQIADGVQGIHPCDRWNMTLPSGDLVTIWAARDLEGLVVRIEHQKRDRNNEYQPFSRTELLDVRAGADEKLFEKPKDYTSVGSYAELGR